MNKRKLLVLCIMFVCVALTAKTDASVDDHTDCVAVCDADKAQCIADAQDERSMCYADAEFYYGLCLDSAEYEKEECLKAAQPGIPATECQSAYSNNVMTCADERAAYRSDCNSTYSSEYFECGVNRTTCVGQCP
jgi:hypothetical protein